MVHNGPEKDEEDGMEELDLAGFSGIAAANGDHAHPLAFLHGAWDGPRCFEGYIRFFAERGWNCYAFARRTSRDRARIEDYLDDTLAVLDQVGSAPIVIGHSLGGLLAQLVAERGRCVAAVLIEPGPPNGIIRRPQAPHMAGLPQAGASHCHGQAFSPVAALGPPGMDESNAGRPGRAAARSPRPGVRCRLSPGPGRLPGRRGPAALSGSVRQRTGQPEHHPQDGGKDRPPLPR